MAKAKLANVSTADLRKEVERRQKRLDSLLAKRAEIDKEIDELKALGASVAQPAGKKRRRKSAGKSRKRPSNKQSLADALAGVLKGKKSMGVSDAADAVLAAGYKTNSKNFRSIVNQTLIKDDRFKQVSRGQYSLK